MKIPIIQIGNSRGIRLSKTVIEKYNLKEKVDMILEVDQIIIKAVEEPRKGWDLQFKEMAKSQDDALLIDDIFEDEEFEEWN